MDAEVRTRLSMNNFYKKNKLRIFGISMGILFPIIIGWLLPSINGKVFSSWTLFIGFPVIILGILAPNLLYYPFLFLSEILSTANMIIFNFFLTLIFVTFILPMAFLAKVFGFDPLKKRFHDDQSYRELKK